MKTVTVVLNGFKRQHTLPEQLEALAAQSHPIEKIFYFNLRKKDTTHLPDYELLEKHGVEYADTSHDYGVWGRFTFALNATTDFICVLDDDVIPGKRYIENCVASYSKKKGIYGTLGSAYDFRKKEFVNYGWKGVNNDEIRQVNYLYQTWFMPREALHAFWSESRPERLTRNRRCGEDMNISLMAKKKLGIKTYVVPHPENDRELWGNVTAEKYGVDEHAIHLDPELQKAMVSFYQFAVSQGMEVVCSVFRRTVLRVSRFFSKLLFLNKRVPTADPIL